MEKDRKEVLKQWIEDMGINDNFFCKWENDHGESFIHALDRRTNEIRRKMDEQVKGKKEHPCSGCRRIYLFPDLQNTLFVCDRCDNILSRYFKSY